MKSAWATDVHLNFVEEDVAERFCSDLLAAGCESLLLGGDIAEASDLSTWIRFLDERLRMPIYFVLGNHDYYGGDIASVRAMARSLGSQRVRWLAEAGVVELTASTGLVGHGGWGDARHGDFMNSDVILSDYVAIEDLRSEGVQGTYAYVEALDDPRSKRILQEKLHALGDEAAEAVRPALHEALARFPHVYVLTHVPPFREACWYEGRISDDNWLPGHTCKAMGDMLLDAVRLFPRSNATVLCGHTHGEGTARPAKNLEVITGGAQYCRPRFRVLELLGS